MSGLPLRIALLGPVRIRRGDEDVPLPKSQKARALLAYLVMTGRAQRRERLCEIFWDVADDPRAALRWVLSKLRALDEPTGARIVATRDEVWFDRRGAEVDALDVSDATKAGVARLSIGELRAVLGKFRGGFLDDLELPDFEAFRAWRVAERERFRELQLSLLGELARRLRHTPVEALPAAREHVRLAPSDEAARASLIELLVAAGLHEEAAEHASLGRRQLEKAGKDSRSIVTALGAMKRLASGVASPPATETARQEIRFCKAPDGTRIAYASTGEGTPLVKAANWMSHLEFDWKSPFWRHLARELGRDFQLLRYDQRGSGLSDRDVNDYSLAACLSDLESVVDAAGPPRFALLGVSQGCRTAVAYAAAHPDRVSHLVLYGGSARGWKRRDASARELRGGLQGLIQHGWAADNPAFRQVFTTLFMPDATPEQAAWFNELQRASASPEAAHRITEASAEADVTELLGGLRVKTLVMHATGDAMVPFDEGRNLAAGIPDARFVALESRNHLLLDDEPAFARFLSEIRDFLL